MMQKRKKKIIISTLLADAAEAGFVLICPHSGLTEVLLRGCDRDDLPVGSCEFRLEGVHANPTQRSGHFFILKNDINR